MDVHAAKLVDGVPEQSRRGFVGVGEDAVSAADEDRVRRLRVQLAVVSLALSQAVDELGIPQRDRGSAGEQAQGLDLGIVEGARVAAADTEHAADGAVVLDRRQDDRSGAGGEAARHLRAGRRAEHGHVTSPNALVAERRRQRQRPALQLHVRPLADLEVRELVVDRRKRRTVRSVELEQARDDPTHDRFDLARERCDLELPLDPLGHAIRPRRSAVATACVRVVAPSRSDALRRWLRTVSEPMPSRAPICSCWRPSASSWRTSSSRAVSVAPGALCCSAGSR